MTISDVACLGVALLALCALGAFVSYSAYIMARSPLPNAQALLALSKLKDLEDEKLKKILDRFQGSRPTAPGIKEQLDEMARKAKAMGFSLDTNTKAQEPSPPRPPEPPLAPPPEPTFDYESFIE